MSHACAAQNIPIATVYTSLGEAALIHALNETKSQFAFTSSGMNLWECADITQI
jgi:long-subunit acyl-CoA synthetase (AMP-forming)